MGTGAVVANEAGASECEPARAKSLLVSGTSASEITRERMGERVVVIAFMAGKATGGEHGQVSADRAQGNRGRYVLVVS